VEVYFTKDKALPAADMLTRATDDMRKAGMLRADACRDGLAGV